MLPKVIEGATRILAKDQKEYARLAVKDHSPSPGVNIMSSSWEPSPVELLAMRNGAAVILSLIGIEHPPVMIEVGPEDDDAGKVWTGAASRIGKLILGLRGKEGFNEVWQDYCTMVGLETQEQAADLLERMSR